MPTISESARYTQNLLDRSGAWSATDRESELRPGHSPNPGAIVLCLPRPQDADVGIAAGREELSSGRRAERQGYPAGQCRVEHAVTARGGPRAIGTTSLTAADFANV